ncbi:MAG: hypothetical protein QME14_09715 [Methanobacteriaceae archaeon]|nr:hypothetical protein [Methanobacteriaceae archaeon]
MISLIKRNKILLIILILLILFNSISPICGAGLWASPPEFKYNLSSSETINGEILVRNIGKEDLEVVVEKKRLLKDSINLLYSDKGIATWITILNNETNFKLSPGQSKTIQFKVTAPEKINYFDAVGALLIRGVPIESQNNNGVNIKQGVELVIPIIVGLPGPIIESLQLLDHKAPIVLLSFMPGDFIYNLNNNGTVYANMTGNIEINGLISSHKVPIEGGVFPEDNYTLIEKWTPGFSDFGLYSADTTIKYGRYQQTKTIKTHDTILVIPVWLIILIILGAVVWYMRRNDIKSPFKIKIERR